MVKANRDRSFLWAGADNFSPEAQVFNEIVWAEVKGDDLPTGLDYFIFDCAVNVDQSTAIKWLRNVLGLPQVAILDRATLDYAKGFDPEVLISGVEMLWRRRLKSQPNWTDIGRKATNHVNRVKHRALKLLLEDAELVSIAAG
jgi:lysozyme family protein